NVSKDPLDLRDLMYEGSLVEVPMEIDNRRFVPLVRNQGGDSSVDSDANPISGTTLAIHLAPGQADWTWDAGLIEEAPPASLGNRVWHDVNGDGLQNGGEPGAPSVEVRLFDLTDTLLDTTTTEVSGSYSFSIAPGDYYLMFIEPPGFVFTLPNQSTDDTIDSDVSPGSGTTVAITLGPGQTDMTWDAGLREGPPPARLGNRVWHDLNGDGLQNGGEPGAPGVEVRLSDLADSILQTTVTDLSGHYSFSVGAGEYYLAFSKPSGFEFTLPDQSTDETIDSDVAPGLATTVVIPLAAGQVDMTWDAGLTAEAPLANVGDRVWHDSNRNGIQDGGEIGIADIEVRLHNASTHSVEDSTTTDIAGEFKFLTGPGDFYLAFARPPGFELAPRDQGADDNVDSDVDPLLGTTSPFSLENGQVDSSWDAGLMPEISSGNLGDRIWLDLDGDGVQDGGEVGVSDVEARLYSLLGDLVQIVRSDQSGFYGFEAGPGDYYLEVIPPPGFNFTSQDQGSDDSTDSDVDPALGTTSPFTLGIGEVDTTIDAGVEPKTIGDFVWQDSNGNGRQDAGEPGVGGVRVDLIDDNAAILDTTITDSSGRFGFGSISTGSYSLEFLPPSGLEFTLQDVGPDERTDSDAQSDTGRTDPFSYLEGASHRFLDAGLVSLPAILFSDGFESGNTDAWSSG
ncbi:MAG: hypothetical protein MI919_43380, partial [Holophagales bacterium]|nr:hypothetical protein [Holophagales bacterium]